MCNNLLRINYFIIYVTLLLSIIHEHNISGKFYNLNIPTLIKKTQYLFKYLILSPEIINIAKLFYL